jgi:hypothetical protein
MSQIWMGYAQKGNTDRGYGTATYSRYTHKQKRQARSVAGRDGMRYIEKGEDERGA